MLRLDIAQFTTQEAHELLYEALDARRRALHLKIAEIQTQLSQNSGEKGPGRPSGAHQSPKPAPKALAKPVTKHKPHRISREARERIIAAQKKRWAAHHKAQRAAERAKKVLNSKSKPQPRPKGMKLDLTGGETAVQ